MMLEESGIVVAVSGESVWVETQPRSACGHCNVGDSCGTSVLAKCFSTRKNRIRVPNQLGLKPGAAAVVAVDNDVLTKAALIAYILPLLVMLSTAMLASTGGANNALVALSSFLGLSIGLWLVRIITNRAAAGSYQVQLIRETTVDNKMLFEPTLLKRR